MGDDDLAREVLGRQVQRNTEEISMHKRMEKYLKESRTKKPSSTIQSLVAKCQEFLEAICRDAPVPFLVRAESKILNSKSKRKLAPKSPRKSSVKSVSEDSVKLATDPFTDDEEPDSVETVMDEADKVSTSRRSPLKRLQEKPTNSPSKLASRPTSPLKRNATSSCTTSPSKPSSSDARSDSERHSPRKIFKPAKDANSDLESSDDDLDLSDDPLAFVPQKEANSGGRKRWTAAEEEEVYRGVRKYGVGKWSRFAARLPGRSNVDIKDKYRTMLRQGRVDALAKKVRRHQLNCRDQAAVLHVEPSPCLLTAGDVAKLK